MKLVMALVACWVTLMGHAQAPAPTLASDSAIQVTVVPQGRYWYRLYSVHHQPLTHATLKALLRRYPPAAAELRKGRVQLKWGLALVPVFVVTLLVSNHQLDQQPGPGSPFRQAPIPFSLCLASFIGSECLILSSDHYGKAIELYNQRFH